MNYRKINGIKWGYVLLVNSESSAAERIDSGIRNAIVIGLEDPDNTSTPISSEGLYYPILFMGISLIVLMMIGKRRKGVF